MIHDYVYLTLCILQKCIYTPSGVDYLLISSTLGAVTTTLCTYCSFCTYKNKILSLYLEMYRVGLFLLGLVVTVLTMLQGYAT